MTERVTIHGESWKLSDIQNEIDWCKHQDWSLRKYEQPDDHEHCVICYWAIFESDIESEGYGYFSVAGKWLCSECYSNFIG